MHAKGDSTERWLLGDEDRVTEVGAMNFFMAVKADDGGASLICDL